MVGGGLSFSALCPRVLEQIEGETINHIVRTVKGSVDNCTAQMREESGYSVSPDTAIDEKVPHQDREIVKSLNNTGQVPNLKTDDYSATKLLASLFRVMTSPIGGNSAPFGAVYLFLDEVETAVVSAKSPQQTAFFGALRTLINEVTENFALVLSFSLPTAVLEAAVPNFLQERMTRPYIQCEQLTTDSAKKFVKDYLSFVRPSEEFSPPQQFYPFSEAAINTIFERETTLLPRKILMHLRRVWERAARYENLESGDEISQEMADEILDGII